MCKLQHAKNVLRDGFWVMLVRVVTSSALKKKCFQGCQAFR